MSITDTPPAIDLNAILPGEHNPDVRHHVQIAVWFADRPGLPATNLDGLRTSFFDGTDEQNIARVDEVARYLGVETAASGEIYSAKCEIVAGLCYEAFCVLASASRPQSPAGRIAAVKAVA